MQTISSKKIKINYPDEFFRLVDCKQEALRDVINILVSTPKVLGVLWAGSIRRKKSFELSDIDLFCNVTNPNTLQIKLLATFSSLNNVEIVVNQGYFPWMGELLTIFYKFIPDFAIDIGLVDSNKASTFFWEPEGFILFDNNNMIHNSRKDLMNSPNFTQQPFQAKTPFQNIILLLKKIRKNLSRGHLWNCIEYISTARRNLMIILRLYVLKDDDYLGRVERDIEDVLPQEMLDDLKKTQPELEKLSIVNCALIIARWTQSELHCIQETSNLELRRWIEKELKNEISMFEKIITSLQC